MNPQTIQLFLPDGSPSSIREAEITNRLVKAIFFPRAKMEEVAKRESVHFTGVYFLFGSDEDGSNPLVYIGEGEDCFKRIQDHNRKKDFGRIVLLLPPKPTNIPKQMSSTWSIIAWHKQIKSVVSKLKMAKIRNVLPSRKPANMIYSIISKQPKY